MARPFAIRRDAKARRPRERGSEATGTGAGDACGRTCGESRLMTSGAPAPHCPAASSSDDTKSITSGISSPPLAQHSLVFFVEVKSPISAIPRYGLRMSADEEQSGHDSPAPLELEGAGRRTYQGASPGSRLSPCLASTMCMLTVVIPVDVIWLGAPGDSASADAQSLPRRLSSSLRWQLWRSLRAADGQMSTRGRFRLASVGRFLPATLASRPPRLHGITGQ